MKGFMAIFTAINATGQWYIIMNMVRMNRALEELGATPVHIPFFMVSLAILSTLVAIFGWLRWYRSTEK